MDKNTLSNYGWIVIAVLVLSVMIALATPFGSYIEQGVRSTTQGLFDTSEKALNVVGMSAGSGNFEDGYQGGGSGGSGTSTTDALNHSGIIPEGATYTAADGIIYNDGDTMPTLNAGDIYVYGDYEYRYGGYTDGYSWEYSSSRDGWAVRVLNTTKNEYGEILTTINNANVKYMNSTFNYCNAITNSPAIPSTVTEMGWTFRFSSLVTAPAIPSRVTDMFGTFEGCSFLAGTITINANPTSYNYCLAGTQITEILGDCPNDVKSKILATK